MLLYRIARKKHASTLDGEGARLFGGRWNKPGTACIYTSESRALAALELAVNTDLTNTPDDLVIITLKLPGSSTIYRPSKLPPNWDDIDIPKATQAFGSQLLKRTSHLIVRLPSVIIPQEYNYIIDPLHPGMKNISILDTSPFTFDTRIKR